MDVAAGGEVHHRVRAVVHRGVQLFELLVDVGGGGGVADVGVDLALRGDADRHGLKLDVADVGGNNHAADRDLVPDGLRRQALALCDVLHFFRNDALPGVVHLRHDGTGTLLYPRGAN